LLADGAIARFDPTGERISTDELGLGAARSMAASPDGQSAVIARLRRLVAALALGWGSTVSEQSLIEAVWPSDEDLPEQPGRSLQVHVSRLRRHLGASPPASKQPKERSPEPTTTTPASGS
jgi:DNA-binding response OmpR family regulator